MRSRQSGLARFRRSAVSRSGALSALLGLGAAAALAGCAPIVNVKPAEDAADPGCASIMLTLPDTIGDQKERRTSSQGTSAWGDPTIAVLRCGVTPPGPTTDQCVNVSGVDWISRPSDEDDTWTFISYGRTPTVEVLINRTAGSGSDVLAAVSPALAPIKPEAKCVGAEDVKDG